MDSSATPASLCLHFFRLLPHRFRPLGLCVLDHPKPPKKTTIQDASSPPRKHWLGHDLLTDFQTSLVAQEAQAVATAPAALGSAAGRVAACMQGLASLGG